LSEYPKTKLTNDLGEYVFTNNPLGYNYELSASKEDDYLSGLSTLDLVKIQRHILELDAFDDPYKILAADASGDSEVSVSDVVQFRKIVLGVEEGLSDMPAWVFVDSDQSFLDETSPWPYIQSIEIQSMSQEMSEQNFIGVKLGDVNESYEVAFGVDRN